MNTIIGNTNYRDLSDKKYIDSTAENIRMLADRLAAENIRFSGRINDYKATITVDGEADRQRAIAVLDEIKRLNPEQQRTVIGNTAYRYVPQKRVINCNAEEAARLNEMLIEEKKIFSGVIENNRARITVSGDSDYAYAMRFLDNIRYNDLISELNNRGFEIVRDDNFDSSYITLRSTKNTGEVFGFDSFEDVRAAFEDTNNRFFHPQAFRIDTNSKNYYIFAYDPTLDTNTGVIRVNGRAAAFGNVNAALDFARANNISVTNSFEDIMRFENADKAAVKERNAANAAQLIESLQISENETHIEFGSESVIVSYYNPDGNDGKGQFVEITASEADIMNAYRSRVNGGDFFDEIYSSGDTVLTDAESDEFAAYADAFARDRINSENIVFSDNDINEVNAAIERIENRFESIKNAKTEDRERTQAAERIADLFAEINNSSEISDDMKIANYARVFNRISEEADYYAYDDTISERENIIRTLTEGKTAWVDMMLRDYPSEINPTDRTRIRELSVLLNDYIDRNGFVHADYTDIFRREQQNRELPELAQQIKEKQREIISLAENGDFRALKNAADEIAGLQDRYDRLKAELSEEELTVEDVDTLRSIQPPRKSVQNMLDEEVAQVPGFERQQAEKMGAKSAFEMRQSSNEWRNDTSLSVPVISFKTMTFPENLSEIRKKENIDQINKGMFVNGDTGLNINLGRKAIDEIIAKAIQDNKRNRDVDARMAVLYNLQPIIENAVCFDSEISEYNKTTAKNKSPNTLFMHKMYGVFKYDNAVYLADLSVEEFYSVNRQGIIDDSLDRLYSLRDIKISPMERGFNPSDPLSGDSGYVPIDDTISIAQL